jgi:hypothetical protein
MLKDEAFEKKRDVCLRRRVPSMEEIAGIETRLT